MSHESDSFIDEVTEEVRRDRLFGVFRRYGWIGILVIALIVGGAAWREYTRGQARAEAEGYGDALLSALEAEDPASALAALDIGTDPRRAALTGLIEAGQLIEADRHSDAAARLELAANGLGDDDVVLRDLARLRMLLAEDADIAPDTRDALLADLSKPGAPFRLLALEQKAIALIGAGRDEDAVTLIRDIRRQEGVSRNLAERLTAMLIALNADPEMPSQSAMAGMSGMAGMSAMDAPADPAAATTDAAQTASE